MRIDVGEGARAVEHTVRRQPDADAIGADGGAVARATSSAKRLRPSMLPP